MTIMASASRAVQEPAALAIPVNGPGSGWAFTDRTPAKQRHVCASPGHFPLKVTVLKETRNLFVISPGDKRYFVSKLAQIFSRAAP